jgi:hypothetical protein
MNTYPGTFSYIGISVPDVEGLVEKIIAHGGKQRMPVREYYPGSYRQPICVIMPYGKP